MDILDVIKLISDTTRLRILNILYKEDLCVCEIEYVLKINQSNASRHLNKMSKIGALESYKVNKYTYYKLNSKLINDYSFIEDILDNELNKNDVFNEDAKNLNKYKNSDLNCDCLIKRN